jgi:hypothetical protein
MLTACGQDDYQYKDFHKSIEMKESSKGFRHSVEGGWSGSKNRNGLVEMSARQIVCLTRRLLPRRLVDIARMLRRISDGSCEEDEDGGRCLDLPGLLFGPLRFCFCALAIYPSCSFIY